jgi:hypothetical protein
MHHAVAAALFEGFNMTKSEKILSAIQRAFVNGTCEWSDIVKSVRDSEIKLKDWWDVRNVLQWMINEKLVTRVKDVTKERYIVL